MRAIDGFNLPAEYRALLRPAEADTDASGNVHHLPRFFHEIGSWQEAHEIRLAPHFTLAELMLVDCREAGLLLSDSCEIAGGFSPRSRCPGFHQRKWWLSVARASDWRREKHSRLGNSSEHIPCWRHFFG